MKLMKGHYPRLGSKRVILAAVMAVTWGIGVALSASGPEGPSAAKAFSSASIEKSATRMVTVTDADGHTFSFQAAQPGAAQTAVMSDVVFKNVQVLKGIPVDDFMGTMGIMSAAL